MLHKKGIWRHRPVEMFLALAVSVAVALAIPQTQDLKGSVTTEAGSPVPAAVCTLKGVGLPAEGIGVTADQRGRFDFPGLQPGQYDLVCTAIGHMPVSVGAIQLNATKALVVQVVLPDAAKLRQSIEVHESATPVAAESANTTRRVTSKQLNALPLVQEEFLAALSVVPGVVRTPDGKINI